MYNKKLLSKAICISAVCVLFASNTSFAADDDKIKEAKVSTNVEVAEDYSIDKFYRILEEKTDIIFSGNRDPFAGKEYLDELKTIADKNKDNKDLQRDYHKNNAFYNRDYENRFDTIDQLKIAERYLNNDIEEQLHVYDQLAKSYTEVWDFNNAYKEYKKIDTLMKNNKKTIAPEHIVVDAASRMYFYLGTGDLDKMYNYYKKGRNVLDSLEEKDLRLELELNGPIIQYYSARYDTKNVKKSLDYYLWLANETEDKKVEEFTLKEYINLYTLCKDPQNTKKTLKKLAKKINKAYDGNSVERMLLDINYADTYYFISQEHEEAKRYALNTENHTKKTEENLKEAEKYARKAVESTAKYKNISPTIYAYSLQKLATIIAKQNKSEEAKNIMSEAIEYHKIASRDISYYLFRGYLAEAIAYHDLKQYDEAIKKYIKLEKEINKKFKKPSFEHIELYKNLSDSYSKINNEKEAIKYIDKAIKICTSIFGEKSIKTLDLYKTRIERYENLSLQKIAVKEAKELIYKIKEYGMDNTLDIEFRCYTIIAKDALAKNQLDTALENAHKALETSFTKINKDEANKLIAEIYARQGETLKALKYKIK